MDFTPRNNKQEQAANAAYSTNAHSPVKKRRKHIDWAARTIRFELFTVIVGSALLLAAVSLYLALSGGSNSLNSEAKRIDKTKYQAVFVNGFVVGGNTGNAGGSLYFGKISKLNDKYLVLNNIYYLTNANSQQASNSNAQLQLTKLGCELHAPYDEMVITKAQVAFWENIKDNSQVAQKIKELGPTCTQQTQSNNQNSSTSQTTTPTPAPTTPPATNNRR